MQNFSEILTIQEVAAELRCSKTHVQHAISGKLTGVPRLTHVSRAAES